MKRMGETLSVPISGPNGEEVVAVFEKAQDASTRTLGIAIAPGTGVLVKGVATVDEVPPWLHERLAGRSGTVCPHCGEPLNTNHSTR